jgi:hypothetical protein
MAGRTLNRRALREQGRQRAAASRRIKVVAAKRNAVHFLQTVKGPMSGSARVTTPSP